MKNKIKIKKDIRSRKLFYCVKSDLRIERMFSTLLYFFSL